MPYTSSQLDSRAERDQINDAMRASDLWRNAIKGMGLNPDGPLKLSKQQQQSLARTFGLPTSDFHIDGAGNINDYHGWKGLPTAAKIAIGVGATVATAGAAGAFGGGAAAASGAAGAGGGAAAAGTGAGVATAGGIGATAIKYGLQYGLPVAANVIGSKIQADSQRDSDASIADYYNRALDAETEERNYRRTFDEEARGYSRGVSEENQRYGRYSDSYGRESDEDDRRYGRAGDTYGRESSEEDRSYGRAGDTYGRESDEERLAYDRSQAIRDKNYGYQQYGNFVETLEPFRASGSGAVSRMSGLMGGPTPQDTGSYLNLARTARESVQAVPDVPDRPTWNYSGTRPIFNFTENRPTWNYPGEAGPSQGTGPVPPMQRHPDQGGGPPVSTSMPVGGSPQLVAVQAPDGEIRSLPRDQAEMAVQRGAKVVS